ncbi:MAG: protease complex subunit PrcB family protein [Candidatus Pacearchaeota archaeon]
MRKQKKKEKTAKETKQNFFYRNKFYFSIVFAFLIFLLIFVFTSKKEKINSFDECVRVGNIVEDSIPKRCYSQDGKVFVEDLGKEISFEKIPLILVNPVVLDRSADIVNDIYSFREVFGNQSFDFEKNSLIVVFAGEKPTGGYSIEIKKITEKNDRLIVYTEEKKPGSGCFLTQAISYPFDAAKIEKTSLSRVELVVNENVYSCGEKKSLLR